MAATVTSTRTSGLYLPSHRGQRLELAVAIETSGSCQRELPGFLGALRGMLGAFDRVTLDDGQLHELGHWQSQGGGGSNVCPVFDALGKVPPQALVVLTDGYISAPDTAPGHPVL